MSDTLQVFGVTYNNVAGFKATDDNDDTQTYIKPAGSLPISQNDTYDVSQYAQVAVNVSGGPSGYESGTYIPASNTQEIQIPVTAIYSNFVFSVDQKPSSLTLNSQTGILGRAFSNGDGYIMDTLNGSNFTGNWRTNDGWRQYANYTSTKIKASFLGNGSRVYFVAGNTYQWLAW